MAAPITNQVTEPSQWIEIFHSKPSMKHCYLLEKLPDNLFTAPTSVTELQDASHIRDGFRVFRMPARHIEFMLTNGTDRNWEDNHGANYIVEAPGRYVVEHGIRHVGDANVGECVQSTMRKADEYIQVEFRADLWDKCFCSYQKDGGEWTPAPGVEMEIVKKDTEGKYFGIELKAKTLACAFNNGGEIWDSNLRNNYKVGHAGKYAVVDGNVVYLEPASKDKGKPVEQIAPPVSAIVSAVNNVPTATKIAQFAH